MHAMPQHAPGTNCGDDDLDLPLGSPWLTGPHQGSILPRRLRSVTGHGLGPAGSLRRGMVSPDSRRDGLAMEITTVVQKSDATVIRPSVQAGCMR